MAENGDNDAETSARTMSFSEEPEAGGGVNFDESTNEDTTNDVDGCAVDVSTGAEEISDDPELEAIKARVREMEEEAEKLKEMQSEVEKQMNISSSSINSPVNVSLEEKIEADNRSVYVGNVDYGATAEELEAHFHGCGSVNRVTILCDKFTGHPKGFAYIEFADKDSVETAQALDESLFRGRQIKVSVKRTNRPGISSTNRPPRGRGGFRSRRGYGGYFPRSSRGGRGYRGRRGAWFSPY